MFCSNCGNEIQEGQTFCVKCGAPQKQAAPQGQQPVFGQMISQGQPQGAPQGYQQTPPQGQAPTQGPAGKPPRKISPTVIAAIVAGAAIVVTLVVLLVVFVLPKSAPTSSNPAASVDAPVNQGDSSQSADDTAANGSEANDAASNQDTLEKEREAAAAYFRGDWVLSGGMSDGQELDAEAIDALQQMGLYVYLQLNADDSAVMSLFGTDFDCIWQAKDASTVSLTMEGDTIDANLENNELILDVDGDVLEFRKGVIPEEAFASTTSSRSMLTGTYGGTGANAPADNRISVEIDGDNLIVRGNLSETIDGSYSGLADGDEWHFVLTPDTTYAEWTEFETPRTRDEFLSNIAPDHFVSLHIQVQNGYVVNMATSA